MIRNHKSLTSQAVQKLKARHRWCLTGTPIQNKMTDFYSLLKFLRCKPFNDWLVWKRWVDNKDMAGAQRLNCISDSILLRRTKDSIKDSNLKLKSKTVKLIKVQLDDDEKKVYEELAHFSSTILAQMLAEKAEKENLLSSGIPTFNAKKGDENPFKDHPELARLHRNMIAMGNVKTHNILELIMRLRQICCHASLARGIFQIVEKVTGSEKSSEDKSDEIWERLMTLSVDNNDDEGSSSSGILTKDNPVFRKDRLSSKVREVVRLLKEDILPRGDKMEKVVVVSQWTSLLDIIKTFLKKEDIWSVLLTGQVPVKDRQAIIEAFNNDILGARVLLLSLTAGGTGLNLIGGNHLLMVDVHWNPQLEAQACDRVYRVGQEKEVFIYK
ncbi:hypothetical protein AAG570_009934 [Ranatra chinensis]|uniref:Helicase C-terminal domain-containing protein n=1 Tax=Ranatra chinensis TaxID=642074 RepID=A0ABD0YQK1_9HEMI